MPEPAPLRLLTADGQVLVTHGRTLFIDMRPTTPGCATWRSWH